MQTIGERLEEARKRKGISLSEASEATKIRSDFLQNIEQNQLDFDLPEIYKRGFVKNYANYLKLDTNTILGDYNAQLLNSVNDSRKIGSSELFGSMDSNPDSEETNKPSLGKISKYSKFDEKSEDTNQNLEVNKTFYIKVGLVTLGVLAFLFVIVGLIVTVLGGGDEPEVGVANTASTTAPVTSTLDTNASSPDSGEETVSLIASGNVYVLVKQQKDNKELIRKTMSAGETLDFKKEGKIDILFTAGENLVIVNPAGERLRPKGEGTAKISIP